MNSSILVPVFLLFFGGLIAASPLSGDRLCGQLRCKPDEFCSETDDRCRSCATICTEKHGDYDKDHCGNVCRDYSLEQRFLRNENELKNFKERINAINEKDNSLFILIGVLVALLAIGLVLFLLMCGKRLMLLCGRCCPGNRNGRSWCPIHSCSQWIQSKINGSKVKVNPHLPENTPACDHSNRVHPQPQAPQAPVRSGPPVTVTVVGNGGMSQDGYVPTISQSIHSQSSGTHQASGSSGTKYESPPSAIYPNKNNIYLTDRNMVNVCLGSEDTKTRLAAEDSSDVTQEVLEAIAMDQSRPVVN